MPDTEELSALADATRYLFHSILLIGDADLTATTPCRDWDLGHLLRHVQESLEHLTGTLAAQGFDTGADSGPDFSTDPAATLRTGIVDLLLAVTSSPIAGRTCEVWGRTLPAGIVVYAAAIEIALHAWDIAQACGTHRPIPADLASALMAVAPPLAEAGVAERVFARAVALPTTETPSDQLLALFGRQPIL